MSASLLCLLNREKALIDEIDQYDNEIEIYKDKIKKLEEKKDSANLKLASARSCLASYIENNLIKLPNDDPYKNARA